MAALAVAALLAGLWFGVLRPAVRSEAKAAVKDPVQAAASQAAEAKQKASGAEAAAAAAQKAAGMSPAPAAPATPSARATPGAGPAPGPGATLFSHRLTAAPKAGQDGTDTYTVPDGRTLRLADLVLENPQGDSGTVTIAVDDKPLLSPALENFREQDFHWASAILVSGKQRVTLTVSCQQVGHPATGANPATCSAAALLSGSLE
ncbi:hypothetical protein ABT095_14045 [Kitasatospora sp. NPDC002227]|uniref:hypothetical protein n=1 Tax=Kitasatospora sp. NPDC002227 TaxID=3154773 RepID=UPI00332C2D5B